MNLLTTDAAMAQRGLPNFQLISDPTQWDTTSVVGTKPECCAFQLKRFYCGSETYRWANSKQPWAGNAPEIGASTWVCCLKRIHRLYIDEIECGCYENRQNRRIQVQVGALASVVMGYESAVPDEEPSVPVTDLYIA